jgi:thiosulfate/3-mercaptopyruvate sulfurtransferase
MSLPLVSVDGLLPAVGDRRVRIVDCRFTLTDPGAGRRAYDAGHVPGAVYLSLDHDLSAPEGPGRHPLPDPHVFAERLGDIGIGNDHTVVAYDDAGGAYASRLWWMLRSLGHASAGILDGGWPAWVAAGGPVSDQPVVHPAADFAAPSEWTGTVDRARLGLMLGEVTLVDARSGERYRGEEEPYDPVAGHIPTAHSLPYADNLDDRGRFRPLPVLRTRFAHIDEPIVVYCGSGVTACHDILAMELAGIDDALLYPGSWSDWSRGGGAVETGPDPHGFHEV